MSFQFVIGGTIAPFSSEVAKMPGEVGKAASKSAGVLDKEFSKSQVEAAKTATQSAKKVEDAWGKSLKGVGEAAKGAGFGGVTEKVGHLSEALEALANPATVAVAAIASIAVAGAAGVAALGSAVLASDEALESLKGFKAIKSDFYPKIPPETLDSIKATNAAMDALGSICNALVVDVGANAAPSFEKLTDAAVGLALTGKETFEEFLKGKSLLHEFAVFMTTRVVDAVLSPLAPLEKLAEGVVFLSHVTGVSLPKGAEEALTSFSDLNRGLAETAVNYYENSAAGSSVADSFDHMADKGAGFIDTQEQATAASKNAAAALKAQAEAMKRLQAAMDSENSQARNDAKSWAEASDSLDVLTEKFHAASQAAVKMGALAGADPVVTEILKWKQALADLDEQRAIDAAAIERQHQAQLALAGDSVTGRETADANARAASLALEESYQTRRVAITLDGEAKIDKAEQDAAAKALVAQKDAQKKAADVQKKALDVQKAQAQQYVSSVSDIFGGLADIASLIQDSIDPKKNKAAYMAAFEANKAFAIAQAVLNTAMAVSQALAMPAPPPLPEIAAVAAGIAGGVQVAKIASAAPPKFHGGTMYASPDGALRADEFSTILQRGEIVVDRDTSSKPGVREAVAAISTGTPAVMQKATHPDDVAEGMDRSSVPGLLGTMISELRRYNSMRITPAGRTGHPSAYAY